MQEKVEAARGMFPLLSYGHLEFREMRVDVHNQGLFREGGRIIELAVIGRHSFSTASGPRRPTSSSRKAEG